MRRIARDSGHCEPHHKRESDAVSDCPRGSAPGALLAFAVFYHHGSADAAI